jgi:NAD(P)-dependent dehydrogenase (short-subunit alcohol dehydrogenase family)
LQTLLKQTSFSVLSAHTKLSSNMSMVYIAIPAGIIAGIFLIRKLREFKWGWVRNISSLKGKIFIITGANTGLGFETAKALVKRQATVIMACRNLEKANEAITKIRAQTREGTVVALELDLASFDSIKSFSNKIKTTYPDFDCLINNAGLSVKDNQTTVENFELHFGVNHLGHFLLVDQLNDNIKNNESRIVVVSSKMHEKGAIDFENLGKFVERGGRFNNMYNNSKLMNFYHARELYKRGHDVHVLCPGLCHTDFFRNYNPKWYHYVMFSPIVLLFLRSARQGAQNIIFAATDATNTEEKNPVTGYMVADVKQVKSKVQFSEEVSEKLWVESAKMCNIQQ